MQTGRMFISLVNRQEVQLLIMYQESSEAQQVPTLIMELLAEITVEQDYGSLVGQTTSTSMVLVMMEVMLSVLCLLPFSFHSQKIVLFHSLGIKLALIEQMREESGKGYLAKSLPLTQNSLKPTVKKLRVT